MCGAKYTWVAASGGESRKASNGCRGKRSRRGPVKGIGRRRISREGLVSFVRQLNRSTHLRGEEGARRFRRDVSRPAPCRRTRSVPGTEAGGRAERLSHKEVASSDGVVAAYTCAELRLHPNHRVVASVSRGEAHTCAVSSPSTAGALQGEGREGSRAASSSHRRPTGF